MNITGKTDKGIVRESNQDAFAFGELPGGGLWAVVCDGMGGANGGSVASAMAVEEISQKLPLGIQSDTNKDNIKLALEASVHSANIKIYNKAHEDEELSGMGTTVVTAALVGGMFYVAHVGDSRAYCLTGGGTEQLTIDHSMVQMMLSNGDLTPAEAKDHPRKHIITRAVGVGKSVDVDVTDHLVSAGDYLLLCTDGLTNFVEADDICKIVREIELEQAAQQLIDTANQNGGGDNITVVIIKS